MSDLATLAKMPDPDNVMATAIFTTVVHMAKTRREQRGLVQMYYDRFGIVIPLPEEAEA